MRWAVQQLVSIGTPDAVDVLRWASKEKGLAGAAEAGQAVAGIEANKSAHP